MNDHVETKAVMEVINNYCNGTINADIPKLQKVFHEKAVMNGYLGSNLLIGSPQPFLDDIGSAPSMASNGDPYQGQVESIYIQGNTAAVILSESGFRGEGKMMAFFHLIKAEGRWSIISKLFTSV